MSGPVVQGFAPIDHPTESLEDAMQKWQTLDQLPAQYRAN